MAREHLSQELIDAGEALLVRLDGLVPIESAMWLHSHLLGDWRYTVFTPLVDGIGRRDVYRRLLDTFEAIGMPPPLTFEDVHLDSPGNDILVSARSALQGREEGKAEFKDCASHGVLFDGLAYRWARGVSPEEIARSTGMPPGNPARGFAPAR